MAMLSAISTTVISEGPGPAFSFSLSIMRQVAARANAPKCNIPTSMLRKHTRRSWLWTARRSATPESYPSATFSIPLNPRPLTVLSRPLFACRALSSAYLATVPQRSRRHRAKQGRSMSRATKTASTVPRAATRTTAQGHLRLRPCSHCSCSHPSGFVHSFISYQRARPAPKPH